MAKRHRTFVDIASALSKSSWGYPDMEMDEAQKKLIAERLGDGCLLRMLQIAEGVLDAIAETSNRKRLESLRANIEHAIKEFIGELEAKHGPVPRELHSYFEWELWEGVGRDLRYHDDIPIHPSAWRLRAPPKGSVARRMWDSLKRRRKHKP